MNEQDEAAWIARFVARRGRKPRVLHVGNIANNAYINCKLLNEAGLDCDLICYDYYHLMGCPEWEEADIDVGPEDQAHPDWTRVDLRGYRRPTWFAQGPLYDCIDYLLARRRGERLTAAMRWRMLGRLNHTRDGVLDIPDRLLMLAMWMAASRRLPAAMHFMLRRSAARALGRLLDAGRVAAELALRILRRGYRMGERLCGHPLPCGVRPNAQNPAVLPCRRSVATTMRQTVTGAVKRMRDLEVRLRRPPTVIHEAWRKLDAAAVCARYAELFVQRSDQLVPVELDPYVQVAPRWSELFDHYDLVQAYATEPILPALTGHRAVAFEHGTLRTFLWGDTSLHRLTSLGYRHAEHVFVTNGDCLEHAERLGVQHYSAMLHPVDVDQHRNAGHALTATIRARYAADCLLLCPLRHDWAIKGTDVHLRALPLIKRRFSGRLVVLLTEWGADLEASKALVRESGCAENVRWIAPLGRIHLIAHTRAAHCVLDQIALPHFGATAPQSLAVGTPVISSYDPRSTEWIVAEPAPILPAFTPEEVADAVLLALDPDWRVEFTRRAHEWIELHHHHRRVVTDHLRVYGHLIESEETAACH